MGDPVPLKDADLLRPLVYDRCYGVFYVPMGLHPVAMSLLLAFQHGCDDGVDVAEKLGLEFSAGTADKWLETTPGSCFKSSVSKKVVAWRPNSLNVFERRIFAAHQDLMYLAEN